MVAESNPPPPEAPAPALGASEGDSGGEEDFVPVRVNDALEAKWRIEKRLGEGGMGTVYLAHDLQLDRKVAVKVLASSFTRDLDVVARFEREARLTAGLEHPNIVPIFAVGRVGNRPFIVMKALQGRTLAAYIREHGILGREELLPIMQQICSGLDFIHSRGFIHRDIKAGNIFLGPDGQVTILDFGILRSSRNPDALTRAGLVVGTPQYMSPEQARGDKEIDHRADLYALAILLFECLTGTLPFEGDSEMSIIQMQANTPPPDLIGRAPWVPQRVAEVVKRALAKNPDERYPSAGELLHGLENAYLDEWFAPVDAAAAAGRAAVSKLDLAPASAPGSAGSPILLTRPSIRKAAEQAKNLPVEDAVAQPAALAAPSPSNGASAQARAIDEGPNTQEMIRQFRHGRTLVVGFLLALAAVATGGYLYLATSRTTWNPLEWGRRENPTEGETRPALVVASAPDAQVEAVAAVPEDAGPSVSLEEVHLKSESPEKLEKPEPIATLVPQKEQEESPLKTSPSRSKQKKVRVAKRLPSVAGGQLNVVTTYHGDPYWALVVVDGVRKGNTPLLLELPPGRHRVRLERSGFRPIERQIKIARGRSDVLRIELAP